MRDFRPLKSGTIGVFAASSPFPKERYQAGRARLESAGFLVREAEGLALERGYLAGSDEDRARGLMGLLEDDSVDALWAVRGGYGLARLLPVLERAPWAERRKAVLGFSDLTALHGLLARLGLRSIHAPVLTQLGELDPETSARCLDLLAGREVGPYFASGPTITAGQASGPLAGGNLSVLASLMGTPYFPPLAGSILLLEDVGEATYRIDRMLTQLLLSGMLREVNGIALGEFTGCVPRNDREPDINTVLADRLGPLGLPVLAGLPFGHGTRNLPIVIGGRYHLDANARTLTAAGGEDHNA